MTLSYFNNVVHLIPRLTDSEMLRLALTESAKILPYVVSSRKAIKMYLKASPTILCFFFEIIYYDSTLLSSLHFSFLFIFE